MRILPRIRETYRRTTEQLLCPAASMKNKFAISEERESRS